MAWRLFTRNGVGWSGRFGALMPDRRRGDRSCGDGLASFDLIRHHRANHVVFLYAFDLIELNGNDLRRDSLEGRKATLEMILAKSGPGIRFNEHCGRRRRDRVSPRLQAGPRRHCLEAEGFALSFWTLARLAQNEERRCAGGEAGGRRGLGQGEMADERSGAEAMLRDMRLQRSGMAFSILVRSIAPGCPDCAPK
jgi:hypothetical protein